MRIEIHHATVQWQFVQQFLKEAPVPGQVKKYAFKAKTEKSIEEYSFTLLVRRTLTGTIPFLRGVEKVTRSDDKGKSVLYDVEYGYVPFGKEVSLFGLFIEENRTILRAFPIDLLDPALYEKGEVPVLKPVETPRSDSSDPQSPSASVHLVHTPRVFEDIPEGDEKSDDEENLGVGGADPTAIQLNFSKAGPGSPSRQ